MTTPLKKIVVGPDGVPITLADLPDSNAGRWVWRRKALLVSAVEGGILSLEEACQRYSLTIDEFMSWKRDYERHGFEGLKVRRIQTQRSLKQAPAVTSAQT